MSWVVIVLVLLVAFGPVLWLVPSKRDKRLTALRGRARTEGMLVEIRRLPKPDPTAKERVSAGGKVREPVIETASYGYPMSRKLVHLPTWRIVRRAVVSDGVIGDGVIGVDGADPLPGWSYDRRPKGEGRAYLARMLDPTRSLVEKLPEDVIAFEVERRMLQVYWLEKPGTGVEAVAEMATVLRSFEGALTALEDEVLAEIDDSDS